VTDSELSIRARCEALDVTEQGYHAFIKRLAEPSARRLADDELRVAVIEAHEVGRETYGTPRLKVELRNRGIIASRRRIARLRDEAELRVRTPRSYAHTTDPSVPT
jgi:putative transposase